MRTLILSLSLMLLSAPALAVEPDPAQGTFTLDDATKGLKGKGKLTAELATSMGKITCELFDKDAPNTVANFVGLARGLRPWLDPKSGKWVKKPFYDGLTFHRVIPEFMIQGGDPLGNGTGNPGYAIKDETNGPHKYDQAGRLAMANAGPNTAGSQFFITELPTPNLDRVGHYQIFGQCDGNDVVKKIARVDKAPGNAERPAKDVVIKKVTIKRK